MGRDILGVHCGELGELRWRWAMGGRILLRGNIHRQCLLKLVWFPALVAVFDVLGGKEVV